MKKVREVADELNVSRQSIYNWLEKLDPEINRFVKQVEGVKVIEEPGIEMIRDNLKVDKQADSSSDYQKGEGSPLSGDREIELLQEQIRQLKEQNEYLKEQIDRKDRRLDNYQVLIKQRTDRVEMLEGEVQEKKEGLIGRVKNFFSGED